MKPVPVTVAALMVTGPVPADVNVTDFATAVFTTALPNEMLVVLTVNIGVAAGFN